MWNDYAIFQRHPCPGEERPRQVLVLYWVHFILREQLICWEINTKLETLKVVLKSIQATSACAPTSNLAYCMKAPDARTLDQVTFWPFDFDTEFDQLDAWYFGCQWHGWILQVWIWPMLGWMHRSLLHCPFAWQRCVALVSVYVILHHVITLFVCLIFNEHLAEPQVLKNLNI